MDENEQLLETFEDFSGRNYFYFGGKLIVGPSGIKPVIMTSAFTLVPLVLFLTFSSPFLYKSYTIVVILIPVILTCITFYFMMKTAFSDPGIIPRRIFKIYFKNKKKFRLVNQKGYITRYKICKTCNIIKPQRSSHCPDCDNCVERFDHHCPWLGSCVGKRNYKYFFPFVSTLNVLTVYMIVFSIIHLVIEAQDTSSSLNLDSNSKINKIARSLMSLVVPLYIIIFGLLSMIFTLGLFIYHTELIVKNMTTKEEMNQVYHKITGNPHKRTFCKNFHTIILPVTPLLSFVDRMLLNQKRKYTDRANIYLDDDNKDTNKKEYLCEKEQDTQAKKVSWLLIKDVKIYNDSENTGIVEEKPKIPVNIEMIENRLASVKENVQEEEKKYDINDGNVIHQTNQIHEVAVEIEQEAQRIFRHSMRKTSEEKDVVKNLRENQNSNSMRKSQQNFNFNNIVYLDENNNDNVESEAERLSCGIEVKDSPEIKNISQKDYKKSLSFYNLIRSHNKNGLDNQDVNHEGVIYDKEIKLNL